MCRRQQLFVSGAVVFWAVAARPAPAWDREAHLSIARTALAVSPAAAARVPAEYRDAFLQMAGEADPLDKNCEYHPTLDAPRDAAAEAEKVFNQVYSGKGVDRPYARAQALGRLAHFASDSLTALAVLDRDLRVKAEYFVNKEFVVFREPAEPLGSPLAEKIRKRVASVRAFEKSSSNETAVFRGAVNLVVDALLLLPRFEAGKDGLDPEGPVVFALDRMKTGLYNRKPASKSGGTSKGSGDSSKGGRADARADSSESRSSRQEAREARIRDSLPGDPGTAQELIDRSRKNAEAHEKLGVPVGGKATGDAEPTAPMFVVDNGKRLILTERAGLQIVEWQRRPTAGGQSRVRMLLFNNDDLCATQIRLKTKTWSAVLPVAKLAPSAVQTVELDVPASVDPGELRGGWKAYECAAPFGADAGIPSVKRLVLDTSGSPPKFPH